MSNDETRARRFRRWWHELREPSLKCARVGHDVRVIERQAYLRPTFGAWSVADRAWFRIDTCRRCGVALGEHEISRTGLTGLTAPDRIWRELEATGRAWL